MNQPAPAIDILYAGYDKVAKTARLLWPVTLVLVVIQAVYYYSIMPEQMASHFDLQGNPDGWSSKDQFYAVWAMLLVVTNIWVPLAGVLFRKLPPSLLNLPNKDYWLATEGRRKKALLVVYTTLKLIIGSSNLLFICLFYHIVQTNLGQQSSVLPYAIVVYVVLLIPAIVYPYRRLRLPKY